MTTVQQTQTVTWNSTEFSVYQPPHVKWHETSGIYIFTGLDSDGLWIALYIGQASSFADRIPDHERWAEAVRLGATHIHAAVVPLAANRDRLEQALIASYQPPLNTHHR